MLIGVPKEIKPQEARVGLTPAGARELTARGHRVLVERGAGAGAGLDDADYEGSGAVLVDSAEAVYGEAGMVVKVKEPQPAEYPLLRPGQILFAYLHLAPDPRQAEALLAADCIAIAYETVTDDHGGLPLLAPMSEVAGRLAVQAGADCLQSPAGGAGVLLAGVPGVPGGRVTVIGGGTVGGNAVRIAVGLGARVTVLDKSLPRLRALDDAYGGRLATLYSNADNLERAVAEADLVVGAVLVPGATAPKLVSHEQLAAMRPGSAVVDVAIDQGGCFATSRPTTHAEPRYREAGVVHYCVANMPGCVPRTATFALSHATLPFVLALAGQGAAAALGADAHLRAGLNVWRGTLTHAAVAESLGRSAAAPEQVLG